MVSKYNKKEIFKTFILINFSDDFLQLIVSTVGGSHISHLNWINF